MKILNANIVGPLLGQATDALCVNSMASNLDRINQPKLRQYIVLLHQALLGHTVLVLLDLHALVALEKYF